MRVPALGILSLCLISVGCTQAPPVRSAAAPHRSPAPARATAKINESVPSPVPAPPPPRPDSNQALQVIRTTVSGIDFEGVAFDDRSHHLRVLDQPSGPGSRFPDARTAGNSINGLAAFNAGFFTPEGKPLGKLISGGTPAGFWNQSSLGGGVFMESPAGGMTLVRKATASQATGQRELLQAGPLLAENGAKVSALDPTKPAVRMFIVWDGGSRWWIGRSSSCTLAELGAALHSGSPAPWPVHTALNLDGGRSADLWISGSIPGGPAGFRPLWNRPVRNFLVLTAR